MRRLAGSLGVILLLTLVAQPSAEAAAPDTGGKAAVPSLMLEAGGSTGTHAFVAPLDGVTPYEKVLTPFGGQRRWLVADDEGNGNGEGNGEGEGEGEAAGDEDDSDGVGPGAPHPWPRWGDWWTDLPSGTEGEKKFGTWRAEIQAATKAGRVIYVPNDVKEGLMSEWLEMWFGKIERTAFGKEEGLSVPPEVRSAYEKKFWASVDEDAKNNQRKLGIPAGAARSMVVKLSQAELEWLYGKDKARTIRGYVRRGGIDYWWLIGKEGFSPELATWTTGHTPSEEEKKKAEELNGVQSELRTWGEEYRMLRLSRDEASANYRLREKNPEVVRARDEELAEFAKEDKRLLDQFIRLDDERTRLRSELKDMWKEEKPVKPKQSWKPKLFEP